MARPAPGRRPAVPARRVLAVALLLALADAVATAGPASAAPAVLAFPADPAAGEEVLPCLPTDVFCVAGEAAGAVVSDVWTAAMLALWDAGLWLLGLAFSVVDALTTPDLSADGPLAGIYPVTFGIGAAVAAVTGLVQLGAAALRRDGQTLGRLLVGLAQFGLVWTGYVGVAALLVTGVSGLTAGLLRALLDIDSLAAFDPSIDVGRDAVDGTVATVLGISSVFLLVPASVGYLLLMLVREAALLVLAATSAISAGGLLAQASSAWFWRSLRWFLAALLVSPVAVLVLGVGVTITEGVVTGAEETSTGSAAGTAVVGCLLILLGAVCPLALFRLLAFVDPGTSSGAALRSSLAASGGLLGALQKVGGGGAAGAAAAGSAGGAAASGAAARTAGDRAQGESTADAVTGGRFAGALRALTVGSAQAGRVAAGVAASAADVLSVAGVGHSAPWYGQPPAGRGPVRGTGSPIRTGASGTPRRGAGPDDGGPPPAETGSPGGTSPAAWPAQSLDHVAPDRPGEVERLDGSDEDGVR
ncbi:hypothetical protein SAMN05660464_3772 [Geodermatophilus dictyosporus]|uniref:TrbL/VirB6 plasmid conjugal transfer protein n=1 Tax=Geodermatophilus dictyosporus TaxID=1523247 RepID=A0A1I5RXN8_9ACTN|nr:hypothetical protein [Geodermatophilus dictyosporus]SFP63223.1 hypothetical protein SAMN05660464_3772 [Geodermatophilus dictyosporus]